VYLKIMAGLLVVSLAGGTSSPETNKPTGKVGVYQYTTLADPLQRCASKAVSGVYGPLPSWKLALYKKVLDQDLTVAGRVKRTNYCPQCSGTHCADGSRVRRGVCAAPKSIPMHSIIWTQTDGLLKVCDRGGAVKSAPSKYLRKGEAHVIDVWVPDCPGDCWTGPGTVRQVPFAVVQ